MVTKIDMAIPISKKWRAERAGLKKTLESKGVKPKFYNTKKKMEVLESLLEEGASPEQVQKFTSYFFSTKGARILGNIDIGINKCANKLKTVDEKLRSAGGVSAEEREALEKEREAALSDLRKIRERVLLRMI